MQNPLQIPLGCGFWISRTTAFFLPIRLFRFSALNRRSPACFGGALSRAALFSRRSPDGYGTDDLISAVFRIEVPDEVRIPRIRERDFRRYGEGVLEGGDMHDNCENFVKMCKARDPNERKSRAKLLGVPFIELDGEQEISKNVKFSKDYIKMHCELSE